MNKKQFILNLVLVGGLSSASAQDGGVSEADLLSIGILPNSIPVLDSTQADPDEKPIAASEINPFSEREDDAPQVVLETESEELKIKKLIDGLPVHGGLMIRSGGPKVLLGDLILKKGSLVPQLIPNQTEQLVVREIDEEKIELAFLDTPEYKGQPRVITKPMDIRPTVGQVLSGGNDEYLVERGRDEMAAEEQLASVLASRALGGSIGTTIPGITVNGKTAKRQAKSGLSSLLRNYGQPGATGLTNPMAAPAAGGNSGAGGNGSSQGGIPVEKEPSAGSTPFDFGGFEMSPADSGQAPTNTGAPRPNQGAQGPRPGATQSNTPAPPSFTN